MVCGGQDSVCHLLHHHLHHVGLDTGCVNTTVHNTKRQKQVEFVISVRPSQPGHTPSSSTRIMRTRHAVASRQWPPNAKFPPSPWMPNPLTPLLVFSSISRAVATPMFVHVVMPRAAGHHLHHVTTQPGLSLIQHHQQKSPTSPPQIPSLPNLQLPSQAGPKRTTTNKNPTKQMPKKKGVPQSGSNPPIPPDRKHLYPTHAPAPHLPCRRAVPFPSTHITTNLTSSSSPRTPHPRKEPSQEEGESNRHACLCRACMLACSSR